MQTTNQALQAAGFKWTVVDPTQPLLGYWSLKVGGIELAVEPLMFDQCYLAVYDDHERTLVDKIPFKPITKENEL